MAERENSQGKGKPVVLDDKKRPTGQFEAQAGPRTTGTLPAQGGAQRPTGSHAPISAAAAPTRTASIPAAQPLGPGTSGARQPTAFQKQQLSSAFQGAREADTKAKRALTLGKADKAVADESDEPTSLGRSFDGESAPAELTGRDVWKAVQAPVQSREGRRSAELYQNVIDQFAVGKNPRYEPDAPDKPRGHIFVWDVSRAMNCEIPHFVGAKELSLGQTVDWLRHEGPMRGWTRANEDDAAGAALEGHLAIVLPKDVKVKQLAVVLPMEERAADGKPFVAGAGKNRGKKLTINEVLGVFAVEYFVHV